MDKASICISCMLSHVLNTFFLMHAVILVDRQDSLI